MFGNSNALRSYLIEQWQVSNLQIKMREADPQSYRDAFECAEYRMVDYDPLMLDYQIAYMQSSGWAVEDYSVTLMHGKHVVGIGPLLVFFRGQDVLLSSSTVDVFPPLFIAGVAGKIKKRLARGWLSTVWQLARAVGVTDWHSQEVFRHAQGLSDWHHLLMSDGANLTVTHDWYVDLSLGLADIKAGFRTSYKSLVNQGQRLWHVVVVKGDDGQALWSQFHELHARVAGRETRSQQTWDLQWEAISQGRGFLVCLFDTASRMVGGGYFHVTPDEAVYAVGAYDRTLFDKPLGHVVQYSAIQEMKARGILWYRIGRQFYGGDLPRPSDKECAISKFKSGFSTHLFPVFRILNNVSLA